MSTGASVQPSLSRGHGDHLPTDLLDQQPAGGDGVAGPVDPTAHLLPGLTQTAQ